MKRLFFILSVFISISAFSQPWIVPSRASNGLFGKQLTLRGAIGDSGIYIKQGTAYDTFVVRGLDTFYISQFSAKVRSLFSGTAPITYSNGVFGLTTPLAIAYGGTNNASLPVTAGGFTYMDGSKVIALSPPGHTGMHIVSTGVSSFAWVDSSAGSGGSGFDSLRNNAGVLEGRKGGVFVPQFTLPASAYLTAYSATRTVPVTISDAVDIGSFVSTNFTAFFEIWINISGVGFAQTKKYFFPASTGATSNTWQKIRSISTSGAYGGVQDADLEILGNADTIKFRIRRTGGSAAASAAVSINSYASSIAFTSSTTTASVSAPASDYMLAKADAFLSSYVGVNTTVYSTEQANLQVGNYPTSSGSVPLTNWNSVGRVPATFFTPTNNGGSSPAAYFPVLMLGRDGVVSQSYANFAAFKIGRYENNGANSRTALVLNLIHTFGPFGIDVMTWQSNGSVGIGTTAPSATAILDVQSTTMGVRLPVMTTTQRNAISSPVTGLEIFCSDCTATDASTGVKQCYNGSAWKNYW